MLRSCPSCFLHNLTWSCWWLPHFLVVCYLGLQILTVTVSPIFTAKWKMLCKFNYSFVRRACRNSTSKELFSIIESVKKEAATSKQQIKIIWDWKFREAKFSVASSWLSKLLTFWEKLLILTFFHTSWHPTYGRNPDTHPAFGTSSDASRMCCPLLRHACILKEWSCQEGHVKNVNKPVTWKSTILVSIPSENRGASSKLFGIRHIFEQSLPIRHIRLHVI
jgi:hypothetical protein